MSIHCIRPLKNHLRRYTVILFQSHIEFSVAYIIIAYIIVENRIVA